MGMALHFSGRPDASMDLLTDASRECPALLSGLAFVLAQNRRRDAALAMIDDMKERAAAAGFRPSRHVASGQTSRVY
jgi:hypothetical protein